MPRSFLTASWRDLILSNWRAYPEYMHPFIPDGAELDPFQGQHYDSLVWLRFLNLTVKGLPAFGHRAFPEVNLRFYVRRVVNGELRREVVFLREMTPRRWGERVARFFYNEPY